MHCRATRCYPPSGFSLWSASCTEGRPDKVVSALIPAGVYTELEFEVEDLDLDGDLKRAERPCGTRPLQVAVRWDLGRGRFAAAPGS